MIEPWTSVDLASSFEGHHFHLHHRDVVKTEVKVTNGALNTATTETDSFIVDLTAPDLVSLWDGLGDEDIEFQVSGVCHLLGSYSFDLFQCIVCFVHNSNK